MKNCFIFVTILLISVSMLHTFSNDMVQVKSNQGFQEIAPFFNSQSLPLHNTLTDWRQTHFVSHEWDSVSEQYNETQSGQYSYHHGSLISSYLSREKVNNVWVNQIKMSYEYSQSDLVQSETVQFWVQGEWVNVSQSTYIYNSDDLMIELFYKIWDNEWVDFFKYDYYYDSGLRVEFRISIWESGLWNNYSRYTYQYSEDEMPEELVVYNWLQQQWKESMKLTYEYNESLLIEYMVFTYQDNQWVNMQKWSYGYDDEDKLISSTGFQWVQNLWQPTNETITTYDDNGNIYQEVMSTYQGNSWIPNRRVDRFWETYVNIEEITLPGEISMKNYPNPFNPSTVIQYSISEETDVKLLIYNIQGRTVKTLIDGVRSEGQHEISWDGTDDSDKRVSSGVYFYRLKTDRSDTVNKMLMLK